jgi:hypothetical protein
MNMAQSIPNLEKVSNYFSLATYHYKNQGSTFANMLIPQVFLVNKEWKMMLQVNEKDFPISRLLLLRQPVTE